MGLVWWSLKNWGKDSGFVDCWKIRTWDNFKSSSLVSKYFTELHLALFSVKDCRDVYWCSQWKARADFRINLVCFNSVNSILCWRQLKHSDGMSLCVSVWWSSMDSPTKPESRRTSLLSLRTHYAYGFSGGSSISSLSHWVSYKCVLALLWVTPTDSSRTTWMLTTKSKQSRI